MLMALSPESSRTILTVIVFVLALFYVRYTATQWLTGPRTGPPMRFYVATIVTLGGSATLILWILYVDYAVLDPWIVVAWLLFVLAECWMVWRVAKHDPLAQEALSDWSWSSRKRQQQQQHGVGGDTSDKGIHTEPQDPAMIKAISST